MADLRTLRKSLKEKRAELRAVDNQIEELEDEGDPDNARDARAMRELKARRRALRSEAGNIQDDIDYADDDGDDGKDDDGKDGAADDGKDDGKDGKDGTDGGADKPPMRSHWSERRWGKSKGEAA